MLACVLLLTFAGCCCSRIHSLTSPAFAKPKSSHCLFLDCRSAISDVETQIANYELSVAEAVRLPIASQVAADFGESAYALAESLHRQTDDRAVDYWARAIAWMDEAMRVPCQSCANTDANEPSKACNFGCPLFPNHASAERLYCVRRSAEARILAHAQCYRRLDPSSHLLIYGPQQSVRVPVLHRGFVWQPGDFNRLLVLESPKAPGNVAGIGVPLIVFTPGQASDVGNDSFCSQLLGANKVHRPSDVQHNGSFIAPGTPFAATGVISLPVSLFTPYTVNMREIDSQVTLPSLVLYNPLELSTHPEPGQIAQSPAMPLAYLQQNSPYDPLRAFLNGDSGVGEARLRFFEPYQACKIPLIFVHGLISDPTTFIEMADAVRADPTLRKRYQIWAFRYPTGEPFLKSAAVLRQQLDLAFSLGSRCEPNACHTIESADVAHRAVIVGHSMGGLIAKLQVTDSTDRLWRSVANMPLEHLRGTPENLIRLQDSFFFTANPNVSRVVYIATPHRGSPWAARCIGRLSGLLARRQLDEERAYEELVNANPNAFAGEFSDSFPSSVELLRPTSRVLQSLASLPSSPQTTVHSIIGDHCRLPLAGRSDGVVPIDSAYQPQAASTVIIDASHTSIQYSHGAQQELLRILRLHLEDGVSNKECSGEEPSKWLTLP